MAKLLLPPRNNIKIDGKSVYNLYLQLKHHFNGRKDIVASNWNLKVSDAAYHSRKDKMFFERLSEKFTLRELCLIFIGNLLSNKNAWVGDISQADPVEFYNIYLGRLRLVQSRYVDDIKNIYYFSKKVNVDVSKIFEYSEKSQTSYIFKLLQSGVISFESFLMLNSFIDIIDLHDKQSNILWEQYSQRLKAYEKLFIVDPEKCKSIFDETLNAVKNSL